MEEMRDSCSFGNHLLRIGELAELGLLGGERCPHELHSDKLVVVPANLANPHFDFLQCGERSEFVLAQKELASHAMLEARMQINAESLKGTEVGKRPFTAAEHLESKLGDVANLRETSCIRIGRDEAVQVQPVVRFQTALGCGIAPFPLLKGHVLRHPCVSVADPSA